MEKEFLKQELYDQSIVVGSLPHPVSMFLLGMFTILIIVLLVDHFRIVKEFKKTILEFESLKNEVKNNNTIVDNKIKELSKKIDSRVDRAISGFKK
jgi:high-affinity nickel permease